MLLVTCGMLCKEQGITVVGICLIYDLCVVNKVKTPSNYTIYTYMLYVRIIYIHVNCAYSIREGIVDFFSIGAPGFR